MSDAIPLSRPDITDSDVQSVISVLRSGRLSMGPKLEEFERLVARRAQRSHGIGVSSGTAGLHVALAALGIGPGDEVITPAFSFIASANCILYVGAKPIFVDCDPRTLNMQLDAVERTITDRTRAIIGVEVFGNPASMPQLAALAARYEIPLIEDACEGLGGRIGRDAIGSFGRLSVFGFYPNKQITTGEGGMIVTNDDRLAALCRSMRNHGRGADATASPTGPEVSMGAAGLGAWLRHERLGYNFRLNELCAALGVSQIERLDELLERRQQVAEMYTRRLLGNSDLILPTVEPDVHMSWFVYVVRLNDHFSEMERNEIIEGLRRHEVGAADYFPAIPSQPFYRRLFGFAPGDFPASESVASRSIALPFFPGITEREVDLVCQTLELMIRRTTFRRE